MTNDEQFNESWAKTGRSNKDPLYEFARNWFVFGAIASTARHLVALNEELKKREDRLDNPVRSYGLGYESEGEQITDEGVVDGLNVAIRLIANEPEKK